MLILIHTYDINASMAVNIAEMITIMLTNSTINYISRVYHFVLKLSRKFHVSWVTFSSSFILLVKIFFHPTPNTIICFITPCVIPMTDFPMKIDLIRASKTQTTMHKHTTISHGSSIKTKSSCTNNTKKHNNILTRAHL